MPRGAGLADQPDGPVRQLARRGRRLRVLLRLHRRRDQPVLPRAVRGHHPDRAGQDPGGGLPPDRGPDRQGHRLGAPAEGADGRQAVLHVLRARRHARPPPGTGGVVGQVQGRVRRRLGRVARADVRAPEGAGRDPAGLRADRPSRRDPGVGRDARRPQAGPGPPDGGLRGVPGAHRPPRGAADRRAGRPRGAREHARLLHRRRQRRQRRGHAERHLQRDDEPERGRRAGDHGVHGVEGRRVRHAGGLQPLRGRLGPRHGHAVPVDQAGGLALGRHAQRDDRALARAASTPGARCASSSIT